MPNRWQAIFGPILTLFTQAYMKSPVNRLTLHWLLTHEYVAENRPITPVMHVCVRNPSIIPKVPGDGTIEIVSGTDVLFLHDDVIKWKPSSRYWPFVRGIHRSPVNSPHKGQWSGALMFSLICAYSVRTTMLNKINIHHSTITAFNKVDIRLNRYTMVLC